MRNILFALLMMFALISCQKEDSNPVGNNDNPYLNGNSEAENSYYPTSKGSWWKYTGILQGNSVTQIFTCLDEIKIDGVYYATLEGNANGTISQSYLRVQNHEYFAIGYIKDYGVKKEYEICMLKEDRPVGETWTTAAINYQGTPNRYLLEIVEKDGTYQVKNKTFDNVIVVKVTNEIKIPTIDEWMGVLSYELYFAKGIGVIKADYGFLGMLELEEYSIK